MVACEAVGRFTVEDKWSPTIGMDSTRLLFVIAASYKCSVMSLDVSGAYLRGKRRGKNKVYLRLPPGLELLSALDNDPRLRYSADGEPLLWRCDRNLYGLQDAGAIFWELARDWLLSLGFVQSTIDPCIFSLRRDGDFVIQGLYVDDSLGVYSSDVIKAWFIAEFELFFDQSYDSGSDHPEFLAIAFTVDNSTSTVEINTPKLWGRLRERVQHIPLPTVYTPLPLDAMELIHADESPENPLIPKDELDVLSVLMTANWGVLACCPAEAFSGALLARRTHKPTKKYAKCLIHFVAYLLAHEHDTMRYTQQPDWHQLLRCFVDSSWANCPDSMRSWFGYVIMFCGCAFAWRSKLEPSVALASRDAEAIAAVYAIKAVLGFLIMLTEMQFDPTMPVPVEVDNKATVDGSKSEKVHKNSCFFAMRLALIREIVRNSLVNTRYIESAANAADLLTKILNAFARSVHRPFLMGHSS